jgi:hypothetical protein
LPLWSPFCQELQVAHAFFCTLAAATVEIRLISLLPICSAVHSWIDSSHSIYICVYNQLLWTRTWSQQLLATVGISFLIHAKFVSCNKQSAQSNVLERTLSVKIAIYYSLNCLLHSR